MLDSHQNFKTNLFKNKWFLSPFSPQHTVQMKKIISKFWCECWIWELKLSVIYYISPPFKFFTRWEASACVSVMLNSHQKFWKLMFQNNEKQIYFYLQKLQKCNLIKIFWCESGLKLGGVNYTLAPLKGLNKRACHKLSYL